MTWLLSGQNSVGVAWAHYIAKTSFSLRSCATFFRAYLSPAGFTPKTLARCIHQGHCRLPSKRISNSVRDRIAKQVIPKREFAAPLPVALRRQSSTLPNWANHEKNTFYTSVVFSFFFLLPCLDIRGPRMCGFFVVSLLCVWENQPRPSQT